MELNKKIRVSGTCCGILPEGAEINYAIKSTYNTQNYGELQRGLRPKIGLSYTLNGVPVKCVQSSFGEGDADFPSKWSYTLEAI